MKGTPIPLLAILSLLGTPLFAADVEFRPDLFPGLEWRNIGPERGGRSLSCTGSPGRTNEYYFGATGGGLWKTTDGGATWFPVTDGKIHSDSPFKNVTSVPSGDHTGRCPPSNVS